MAGCIVVLLVILLSVGVGAADIDAATVWHALVSFDGSTQHIIIRTLRFPRAVIAVLVGAALAVAGALMQALTRNPLADPGLLGIETGAALGVVTGVFLFQISSLSVYALCAFGGAIFAALAIYGISALGRGGISPLTLTIAGAALTALLSSWTTGILLFNQRTLDEVRFWLAGSIAGRDLSLLIQVAPYLTAGLVLAFALGRPLTTLALGDDVAAGLGQRTMVTKGLAALAVVLLAGAAVAVAGPISFIGLVIPHTVRFLVGTNYRWLLPYAALCGGAFLLLADIAARIVARPAELPVGIMTALIGGPCFVFLVRRRIRR